MKFCKAIIVCLLITLILSVGAYAASTNDDAQLYLGNIEYTANSATVYVKNNANANKSAMLIVATYDEANNMTALDVARKELTPGEEDTLTVTNIVAGHKVVSYVMEGLLEKSKMPMPAVKGVNSTELEYIKVNGKLVEGFSSEKEKYIVEKTNNLVIEAVAKDNSTEVAIIKRDGLNLYDINIKSHDGDLERTVTVAAYENVRDTIALDKITYVTDTGFTGEITNTSEVVVLPKFTKTVKVSAVSNYGEKIEYFVKNEALSNPVADLGDNGIISGSNAKAVYTYTRPAKDQIIPIKNEESFAVVAVTGINASGKEEVKEYKIHFTAQQPRITKFNYEHGYPYPVFVGGAALYNDAQLDPSDPEGETVLGGSPVIADRNVVCADMPEEFIGASSILFPLNAKDGGWYKDNTSGEYFSFVADTGGTIYIYAQNGFKNSEYTSDKHGEGWKESTDKILDIRNTKTTWSKAYYRTFKKGETVKIYHIGRNGTSTNDYKATGVIIWNENIITSVESGISADIYALKPIEEQLPTTVKTTIASGDEVEFDVVWDTTNYDPNGAEIQTITGTLSGEYVLSEGVSDIVTATLYVSHTEDCSANLDKIIYVTDAGVTGEITDFTQVVELPKYTRTVTLEGVSEQGEKIEYFVKNDTLTAPGFEGINATLVERDATTVFTLERPAKDATIPIKNEKSSAVIVVSGTSPSGKATTKRYEVAFVAQQTRITEFNYSRSTDYYPVVVTGAALYNDAYIDPENSETSLGGPIVSSDRNQIATVVPEELIGASSILFPVNNKAGGWYADTTSGEYFNFVADSGGTIYVFAQNGFRNSEYTSDSHGDGWRATSGMTFTLKNPGASWSSGYYREFQKGETVTVYHIGRNSTSSNDYKITCAIVWKENVIKSIGEVEINVDKAIPIEDQLPETVKATILCGDEIDVEVAWDISDFDSDGDSTQTIHGIVSGDYMFAEGVENLVVATVNLVQNEIVSIEEFDTINIVQYENIEEILPATVNAETILGETVECDVVWNTASFDNSEVGIVTFEGEITPPTGILNDGITASVTVVVRYADEHIIFALEENGMDREDNKWIDLSSYGNDVELNIDNSTMKWTEDGLYTAAGKENALEIPAGTDNNIYDAIKAQSFTIEFETAEINTVSGKELPFFTADINFTRNGSAQNGNLIVNYNNTNSRNYIKFGGGMSRYWALDSLDTINLCKNTITVERSGSNSIVTWYVDGVARSSVTLSGNGDVNSISKFVLMGQSPVTTNAEIGGSIVWKSFRIYDYVLDVE